MELRVSVKPRCKTKPNCTAPLMTVTPSTVTEGGGGSITFDEASVRHDNHGIIKQMGKGKHCPQF